MNDEKVMRIIEEWWDEEQRIRAHLGTASRAGQDMLLSQADQLATCRNQLAVAAGLDAEPGK